MTRRTPHVAAAWATALLTASSAWTLAQPLTPANTTALPADTTAPPADASSLTGDAAVLSGDASPLTGDAAAPTDASVAPREKRGFDVWPVRIHVAMPLGSTWGRERVNGFSWGFRGELAVYPTRGWRGLGLGGFAEVLLDGETHSHSTLGAQVTYPLFAWPWGGFRAGLYGGVRDVGEGREVRNVAAFGALLNFGVPAYLYDLALGFRYDVTVDGVGVSAQTFVVDVDLAVVIAAFGAAGAGIH